MCIRWKATSLALAIVALSAASVLGADNQDDPAVVAVRKSAANLATAFNAGKVDELVAIFLPKGELIDEKGTVYQGRQEIKDLLTAFFAKFPGAKLKVNAESVRLVGPIAIDEGTRTITTKDGAVKSQFRYIGIWSKTDGGWQLASFRDIADDPAPTPHDNLQPIAWLEGDWINEGADGRVAITYHWSDDKNYLLGDFQFTAADGTPRKSTQRIGWDPSIGKIRSWLFDTDGGFAEGRWTAVDDGIVIKSSTVNPDGATATATLTITPEGKDRYTIAGTERIVGNSRQPDFKITVVRRPAAIGK